MSSIGIHSFIIDAYTTHNMMKIIFQLSDPRIAPRAAPPQTWLIFWMSAGDQDRTNQIPVDMARYGLIWLDNPLLMNDKSYPAIYLCI